MLARTNGYNAPAAFERKLAELAASQEQRIVTLRDALGDFIGGELAQRDAEIATLKKHIGDLELKLKHQSAIDERVHEVATRLEEKAARVNEAKRGPRGLKGDPGSRGEPGLRGERGPAGKDAELGRLTWHIDGKRYRVIPFLNAQPLTELNLRPLFEQFHNETSGAG